VRFSGTALLRGIQSLRETVFGVLKSEYVNLAFGVAWSRALACGFGHPCSWRVDDLKNYSMSRAESRKVEK